MAPPLQSLVIQKLLNTNAHVGRRVVADHLKQFSYGSRDKIGIVDSDKMLVCLRSAAEFISSVARQKGRVMFANTDPQLDEIVEQTARKMDCYTPSMKLLGGSLTNRFSPKKFRSRNKRLCFAPAQLPDCLVVFGSEIQAVSLVDSAHRLRIPVVSLVDSEAPVDFFRKIAYPIPANGSVEFVYLFCNLITKTYLLESRGANPKSELEPLVS